MLLQLDMKDAGSHKVSQISDIFHTKEDASCSSFSECRMAYILLFNDISRILRLYGKSLKALRR